MSDRRDVVLWTKDLMLLAAIGKLAPSQAFAAGGAALRGDGRNGGMDLIVDEIPFAVDDRKGNAVTINGTVPGPLLRFREGEDVTIRVTNRLAEATSIHWHGILLPPEMDGVPGVSFAGISPGEIFVYRFRLKQSGTYWYHSHSGNQEQMGMYGPLIIDPVEPEPFRYDRDHVVVLSDWSSEHPQKILAKLKKQGDYYNFQKQTVADLAARAETLGWRAAMSERIPWVRMRMSPTDTADVTGFTYSYLMNGLSSRANWTGIFTPGERVRLRFINAGAGTLFDVRLPGLKMTVVQADGQYVQPVVVDEFRIGPGETYDVIVEPADDRPYTVVAESTSRTGFALGTLSPRLGLRGAIPTPRKPPVRGMADMGMAMAGMADSDGTKHDMAGMKGMSAKDASKTAMPDMPDMPDMAISEKPGMAMPAKRAQSSSPVPGAKPVSHGPDHHGPGNSVVPMETRSRMHEPGIGLEDAPGKVLVYADLRSLTQSEDQRQPEREIELHLTGNMERFMWSIDGKKYSESKEPIAFRMGERLRLTMVNDTMMEHPMHLHGMWMYPENGAGANLPYKHTITVKPAERLSVVITVDALGDWAFHCHILLHMEMGMFRVVRVAQTLPEAAP